MIKPMYETKLFTDVWDNAEDFSSDVTSSGLYNSELSDSLSVIFYLLYAKYGNSPIANLDENQFKYKVYSIIYTYGPTWRTKKNIQKAIRAFDEPTILAGSKAIYNTALNPQTLPTSGSTEELGYINQQNTTNYKKNKLEAYSQFYEILSVDATEFFINKFADLFLKVVLPQRPALYKTEILEDE